MGSTRLYTVDTALEALKKYDIFEPDMQAWEKELNLEIPVDAYGRKQYSPHHVNLFKNIKKHIALGRTIGEIKQIINLPPIETSKPQPKTETVSQSAPAPQPTSMSQPSAGPAAPMATIPAQAKVIQKSPYASTPRKPAIRSGASAGAAEVINLVQRLNKEKDQLYKKLLETEKLNSHLYSANNLFHKKVREMALQIQQLRENFNENEKFKLMDDKARLHKQLIDAEKLSQYKQEEILNQKLQNEGLRQEMKQLEGRISALSAPFNADKFKGDWMETGHLVEVIYDNFGINIESERVRLFRISEKPTRMYGQTAIINTAYQYETNSLWKRDESLIVSYIDEQTLDGELIAEYILDGVPVAKAVYRVTCRRSQ